MLRTMCNSKGEICPNGAAARLAHSGDRVIVIPCPHAEAEMGRSRPRTSVDEQNRVPRDALRALPS